MLKNLDEFVDEILRLGIYDINTLWIVMHPLTMNRILQDLGLEKLGRIDFYKGIKVGIDPSYPINCLYTKYH